MHTTNTRVPRTPCSPLVDIRMLTEPTLSLIKQKHSNLYQHVARLLDTTSVEYTNMFRHHKLEMSAATRRQ